MATVTELEQELSLYKTARENILQNGQDVRMSDGRQVTFADLKWIDSKISSLEKRIVLAKKNGKAPGSQVVFGGHLG